VQNVISYTVVISAANPDLSLLPGMTANVRIVVDQRDNVLKVANAALRFRPAGREEAKAADAPPAAQPQQPGSQAAQAFRQRLMQEVKPDDAQKPQLEQILDDTRQKLAGVRDITNEQERRKQVERIRTESRARIAEILKPEQKVIYERIVAELAGRSGGTGRVWLHGADGQPRPVELRLGLTDGTSTEIVSGDLKEGAEVILGTGDAAGAQKKGGVPGPRLF
jgi:HlyD family secretion protein